MKQFLKITKTKVSIFLVFLAVSFVWGSVMGILYRAVIKAGSENLEYYNIFQVLSLMLFFIEFYLLTCLAVYLVEKKQ